ncbi:hypothetical protein COCON_G00076260 [Conger conger]|uniref:Ig-like domain-containing protein n=1 Tax=Conger conger TaxID=82655 RepID=A0A9Q1DNT1_CONCO|nr:myelin protein zero-like protein 2 [Conger conger]KAJ8275874.1 hypothetical protein COCON_G00076260 [Conger conger]
MEEILPFTFALLVVLAGSGVFQVNGMTVYTPEELEAVNGTDVKLKCTFQSTAAISPSVANVVWTFRPLDGGSEESVFYFQNKAYPPSNGRFKGLVVWAGDIAGGDASILLRNVKFTFNGTFSCQVKNPPDVHGLAGDLLLKVVRTASISEITILASAVGGAIGLVLIILAIFVLFKYCRRRSLERELEMSQWDRKDPTVCDPEDTLPLNSIEEVVNYSSDEASIREINSKEDEKKSLEAMAEDTADTVSINSDIIPAKDDTYIIAVTTDADAILAMNDTDVIPEEGLKHPSGKNKEATEKTEPEEEVPTTKGDPL